MKLLKLLFVALLFIGCSGSNDDEVYRDIARDLSGVYEGTITVTEQDFRPESAGVETSYHLKTVLVVKVNNQYIVTNYEPNINLSAEGYGKQTIDDRNECPYGTCRDERDWYRIIVNEIDINGNKMNVTDSYTDYNFEGVKQRSMIFEGEIQKR